MKKALFLYWHGLGDVIMLTPLLRYLHNNGYTTDLLCRESVRSSKLLDDCPYVDNLIMVENPWRSPLGFSKQVNENVAKLKQLAPAYDWSGGALHTGQFSDKVRRNFGENGFICNDLDLEVFIPAHIEEEVTQHVTQNYPNGFIFNHTKIEYHKNHDWDSSQWIAQNLPKLPIVDTGYDGNYYRKWEDIRYTFALIRHASHRVVSSSVFVHVCDALKLPIDVVNYGTPDRKVWPYDQELMLRIREKGKWIKQAT